MLREVLQLTRALVDACFELGLVVAGEGLRSAQLFRHFVEGEGKCIELADATRRDARVGVATRQLAGRRDEPANGMNDAANRADADAEQQEQDDEAQRGDGYLEAAVAVSGRCVFDAGRRRSGCRAAACVLVGNCVCAGDGTGSLGFVEE